MHTVHSIQAAFETLHVNRHEFSGVLTLVDTVSDKPPSGTRGHKVILSHKAADDALPGLIGMAVGCNSTWNGHDARNKVGIITKAWIEGRELKVEGYVFKRDFPEIVSHFHQNSDLMGMSYELADAYITDLLSLVWTITKCEFTGAAILYKKDAAYKSTSFHLKGINEGNTPRTLRNEPAADSVLHPAALPHENFSIPLIGA